MNGSRTACSGLARWRFAGLLVCMVGGLGYSSGHMRAVELRSSAPVRYTVVEGDTLWDIAARFLDKPWDWSTVWRKNPAIADPDRIYPGDVIVLDQTGATPRLSIGKPSDTRLQPGIRVIQLSSAIPVIPARLIRPFLTHPRVVDEDDLSVQPYVVELAEEHVLGAVGGEAYVRSITETNPVNYIIYRPGSEYQDGETGEPLGTEALFIAEATLRQTGDPATLVIGNAEKEVRTGDRLMPAGPELIGFGFSPHPPRADLSGHIIGVLDGVTQIGQFSVVSLDRGQADGVEVGHVFEIWQKGQSIRDTVRMGFGDTLTGPEQKAGVLMVFQIFQRVSFALVMKAERFIHVQDRVRAPS